MANEDAAIDKLSLLMDKLVDFSIHAGEKIVVAIIVFIVGKLVIKLINKLLRRILSRKEVDEGVKTFLYSLTNILLTILLVVSVIGALGVNTASFAALLASAGVAIGMALSGNLQNFAGGLIILIFKPYKVGDFIEVQNVSGTVNAIQILNTVIITTDNKVIYVPNGSLSSGTIINYSRMELRRVDFVFGVDYGTDFSYVKTVVEELISEDDRILDTPAPLIALNELADSSVNVALKVWVKNADYWGVYYDMNKNVYARFNEKGISFPFPQLTVHTA
ncbi:MAG TPA: mechanosensitive ion channel [Candidatus Avibacteroides avistercoris]|uniref:Mechanosensitive ion channel n=1 Tax=Candidatus Avibacteroides avistercoris TaxID=2840690 RepID=A0A9D2UHY9_9BACT|nr:mechanosensitive ion channel [Candidatus Avibacteroides avistercoris]